MTEEQLFVHVYESDIFKKWHWFRYHFELKLRGANHPFSEGILQARLDCERRIPGFAAGMIDAIASISGREKDRRQYEQLMARLAELLVIRHAVNYPWPFHAGFRWEPTAAGSKKNPELMVTGGLMTFGVEVRGYPECTSDANLFGTGGCAASAHSGRSHA
ncbi:MAG: hypothetical protein J0I06_07795 [Planctomycetes bacterium]|nr:hypothetical protein [Planctomycetota bacterium]